MRKHRRKLFDGCRRFGFRPDVSCGSFASFRPRINYFRTPPTADMQTGAGVRSKWATSYLLLPSRTPPVLLHYPTRSPEWVTQGFMRASSKAAGFGDSSVSPTDSVSQQNRETARSVGHPKQTLRTRFAHALSSPRMNTVSGDSSVPLTPCLTQIARQQLYQRLCAMLRKDGVTYQQYVTELTTLDPGPPCEVSRHSLHGSAGWRICPRRAA
jgi:hypothetical protein